MWDGGFTEYIHDWWNLMDFAMNSLYLATISLKIVAYVKVKMAAPAAPGPRWLRSRHLKSNSVPVQGREEVAQLRQLCNRFQFTLQLCIQKKERLGWFFRCTPDGLAICSSCESLVVARGPPTQVPHTHLYSINTCRFASL